MPSSLLPATRWHCNNHCSQQSRFRQAMLARPSTAALWQAFWLQAPPDNEPVHG